MKHYEREFENYSKDEYKAEFFINKAIELEKEADGLVKEEAVAFKKFSEKALLNEAEEAQANSFREKYKEEAESYSQARIQGETPDVPWL